MTGCASPGHQFTRPPAWSETDAGIRDSPASPPMAVENRVVRVAGRLRDLPGEGEAGEIRPREAQARVQALVETTDS